MRKLNYIPLLVFLLTTSAAAQVIPRIVDRPIKPKSDVGSNFVVGEVKGTVPSKAVFLAKPEYPIEARWAGAEGLVRIEIEIDKEGNVSKASVVSGASALHAAAEDAARRSKFRIERDAAGEPVSVNGVLAYEFEIRKATWAAVGWGLSGLEMLPASTLPIPAVRKSFAADWQAERELLDRIDTIRKNNPEPLRPTFVRVTPTTVRPPAGRAPQSVSRGMVNLPGPPPSELKTASAQLITSVRTRLGSDPIASWQFDLGIGLRKASDEYRNPFTAVQAPATVKSLIESAPNGTSPAILKYLREVETILAKRRTMETMQELTTPMSAILFER